MNKSLKKEKKQKKWRLYLCSFQEVVTHAGMGPFQDTAVLGSPTSCKEPLTHAPGSIPIHSLPPEDGIRWSRYLVVAAALSGMKACSRLSRKHSKLQMIWRHIAHDQPAQRAQGHSLLECEGIAVSCNDYSLAFQPLLCCMISRSTQLLQGLI